MTAPLLLLVLYVAVLLWLAGCLVLGWRVSALLWRRRFGKGRR